MKLPLMVLAFILSGAAQASVWDQMQNGETSRVTGKVESLEISGGGVKVGLKQMSREMRFCDDFSTEDRDNGYFDSESRRAALAVERLEILRDAYKSGETVELTMKGPWNPCLQSVRLVKTPPKAG
jgi:hypothetical protein